MTNTNSHRAVMIWIPEDRLRSLITTAAPVRRWANIFLRLPTTAYAVEMTGQHSGYDVPPKVEHLSLPQLCAALGELLSQGSYAACQFVMGKEDASHADVILQQAVFGEVVYG